MKASGIKMKASGIKMEIHIHYFTGRLCGNVYTYNRYIETSISILGQVRLGQDKICPGGLE